MTNDTDDKPEFGPAITKGGPLWSAGDERPVWLRDDDALCIGWNGNEDWLNSKGDLSYFWRELSSIHLVSAIRLPTDHPASIAQAWNDAHPDKRPFDRVRFGGGKAPGDWDNSCVLMRESNGVGAMLGLGDTSGFWEDGTYIAYRTKPKQAPTSAPEPSSDLHPVMRAAKYVRNIFANGWSWSSQSDAHAIVAALDAAPPFAVVPKMAEGEAVDWCERFAPQPAQWSGAFDALALLGLILPDPSPIECAAEQYGVSVETVKGIMRVVGEG